MACTTANRLFIVPYLIFWRVKYALEDFKKSLSHMCFLIKFSYGPYTKKPFAGYHRLSRLLCLCLCYFLLSSVSRFGHPNCLYSRTINNFLSLFITRSDTFFFYHKKWLGGWRKLTSQTVAFRKVIRARILF